jgi:hypothetical protein
MPEPITIPCSAFPQDTMSFDPQVDAIVVDFRVHNPPGDGRGAIRLEEAEARELFNWLGVWLHTR